MKLKEIYTQKRHLELWTLLLVMALESYRITILLNFCFGTVICFKAIKIASNSPSKLIVSLPTALYKENVLKK